MALGLVGAAPEAATVHSRSGQFVVHSPYATTPTLAQFIEPTNQTRIALAPDALAVSCERIKAGVLRELDLADRWQGKVHVSIRSQLRPGAPPGFVATRYADGWQYTVDLPEQIEATALVRGLVLALLTEMANRVPGPQPAEIPLWLVEGLSARLSGRIGPELVVAPNAVVAKFGTTAAQVSDGVRERVGAENLPEIRAWLLGRTPLTFTQVSMPEPGLLAGEAHATYRFCAELLFYQLRRLPHGPRCLQNMLSKITRTRNWQTAFLEGFSPHFGRLLDVEKWWTLTTQSFLLGDQPNSWPRALSLDKLAEVLAIRVEVQNRPGGPRRPDIMSLQDFMNKTPFRNHQAVLSTRLGQLEVLQRRVAPETVSLIRSYENVLREYLTQYRQANRTDSVKRIAPLPPALLLRETTQRLNELDRERGQLRSAPAVLTPGPPPPTTSP